MVLESLVAPKAVRKRPHLMLADSIVLSSIALWISLIIFPETASVLNIAFIVIASMPLIHRVFALEEEEEYEATEKKDYKASGFLKRHFDMIAIYAWFFIGLVISYAFWYMALPAVDTNVCFSKGSCFNVPARDKVFIEQEKTLKSISLVQQMLTGNAAAVAVPIDHGFSLYFGKIFSNNLMVLILSIVFSFIYGAGALFLISWNASIIGIKVGQSAVTLLASHHFAGPIGFIFAYFNSLFYALGFLPHGIFEVPGFFVGAIAGGLISIAMTRRKYRKHEMSIIMKDAMLLIIVAVVFVLLGAAIESYLLAIS